MLLLGQHSGTKNDTSIHSSGRQLEDDCCSPCGQNDSDAHSLATNDDRRSGCVPRKRSECCQACPVVTPGLTAKTEDNVVASTGTDGAYIK